MVHVSPHMCSMIHAPDIWTRNMELFMKAEII